MLQQIFFFIFLVILTQEEKAVIVFPMVNTALIKARTKVVHIVTMSHPK